FAEDGEWDRDTPCQLEVQGTTVVCLDAQTGLRRWQRSLAAAPTWGACFEDIVLLASASEIESRSTEDGDLNWFFPAPPLPSEAGGESALSAFRLNGSALFFLQGERRF